VEEALMSNEPRVMGKDEGEVYKLGTIDVIVKESGSRTRDTHSVAEFRGKQFRIPPHVHTLHDETIYLVEGKMGVLLGDKKYELVAGESFAIPIGVTHSVWNETDVDCRFLNIIAPASYLSYFHELSLAAKEAKLSPETITSVMGRYGLEPRAV
jgi:mannose-6-phosphate isomerase-like protein (cupin superfamily)